jgi:hypothetical protein
MSEAEVPSPQTEPQAPERPEDFPERPGEEPARSLAEALVRARARLSGVVFKGGRNEHNKYPFVGHEHVIRYGVREALGRSGLALLMISITLERVDVPAGKIAVHLWQGIFRLTHASTGEFLDLTYAATVQGNDKSAFVASTSLERVALQRVLMLTGSSDEDVEAYRNTDDPRFVPPGGPQNAQGGPGGPPRHGNTLPAPGGAPPPSAGSLALVRGTGGPPEQVDLEHAAKQATYNRFERALGPRRDKDALVKWILDVLAERLADDLKNALWILFSKHATSFGFDPHVVKAEAQRILRGAK